MINSFFNEASETIDITRGNDLNHEHLKEKIVFLNDKSFIAKINNVINFGDKIYVNGTEFTVLRCIVFDDYVLFKTK